MLAALEAEQVWIVLGLALWTGLLLLGAGVCCCCCRSRVTG